MAGSVALTPTRSPRQEEPPQAPIELPDAAAAPEAEPPDPTQQGGRRTIAVVIVAVLLGAGVWFLIGQAASYSNLLHAITRADPWWLAGALVLLLVVSLLAGLRRLDASAPAVTGADTLG